MEPRPAPGAGAVAYGLEFRGLPARTQALFSPAGGTQHPVVGVAVHDRKAVDATGADDVVVNNERATLRLAEGRLGVERRPALGVTYELAGGLTPEALVHPYLAFPAAVINGWLGRTTLHAGALTVAGRAVAILGSKESGKSTTMAAAAAAGLEVMADDLLVLDGTSALVGPRAVDLRSEAAARFGGRPLGRVGARDRWRIDLPPARQLAAPLACIVQLDWGDALRVEPVAGTDRVAALLEACALGTGWMPVQAPLDLIDVPQIRLQRRRDLDAMDATLQAIVELVA